MANGSSTVIVGVVIFAVLVAALAYFIRRFRYTKDANGNTDCSFSPLWIWEALYTTNHLHWKWNMLYVFNLFCALVCIPCCLHLATCANHGHIDGLCSWSLVDLDKSTNPTIQAAITTTGIPAHGAAAFGFVTIIFEMIFSIVVSMLGLRWHSESNLDPNETEHPSHMRTQLEPTPDFEHEWNWIRWNRWLTFGAGVWTVVFGFTGRCIIWALMAAYEKSGVPQFDQYGYGEMVAVIIFSLLHLFTFLGMCCKKTWGEQQDMHGDYAAFVCGTCGGSQRFGMNGEEACPSCCGKGVVFEIQNSHFSSTVDSNEIPIHYTKQ